MVVPWSCFSFLFFGLWLESVVHLGLAEGRANKRVLRILLVFIADYFVLAAFFSFSMLAPLSILLLSMRIAVRVLVKGLVGS